MNSKQPSAVQRHRRVFKDVIIANSLENNRYDLTPCGSSWVETRLADVGLTLDEFDELWRLEKPSERATINLYGRIVTCPRYTKNYLCAYEFSGKVHETAAPSLPPALEKIFRCSKLICPELNQCLVNFYDADGCINKHSDDEPCIIVGSPIHSWTFGPATRQFVLEPKIGYYMPDPVARHKITVVHNSFLIMGGTCQQTHVHHVPKAAGGRSTEVDGRRINVTFRCLKKI